MTEGEGVTGGGFRLRHEDSWEARPAPPRKNRVLVWQDGFRQTRVCGVVRGVSGAGVGRVGGTFNVSVVEGRIDGGWLPR